jgi:hypothetical protein
LVATPAKLRASTSVASDSGRVRRNSFSPDPPTTASVVAILPAVLATTITATTTASTAACSAGVAVSAMRPKAVAKRPT